MMEHFTVPPSHSQKPSNNNSTSTDNNGVLDDEGYDSASGSCSVPDDPPPPITIRIRTLRARPNHPQIFTLSKRKRDEEVTEQISSEMNSTGTQDSAPVQMHVWGLESSMHFKRAKTDASHNTSNNRHRKESEQEPAAYPFQACQHSFRSWTSVSQRAVGGSLTVRTTDTTVQQRRTMEGIRDASSVCPVVTDAAETVEEKLRERRC